mmetsp:Transcript_63253/g.87938  ORF Transcript_63253/g.87938 Transcript_63253/m.87938 type:complete len:287 (+) Transcript_63253:410-1270(+)
MPTESKKAPSLERYECAYEIPYISTLRHLFNFKGIFSKTGLGGGMGGGGSEDEDKQEAPKTQLDQFPIFLKHTLFHNEEKFGQIRKLEVSHRFFVYDKFKEQGNKKFNKGKTEEAISLFEHALSCFKWLEMKAPEKKKKSQDEKNKKDSKGEEGVTKRTKKSEGEDDELEEEKFIPSSKEEEKKEIEIGDGEEKEEDKIRYDPLESMRSSNKVLASILANDEVIVHDGEEISDANEKDMRNSMMMNIYLSLSCCYLKLHHYTQALEAIEEGIKIHNGNSQLLYRRA